MPLYNPTLAAALSAWCYGSCYQPQSRSLIHGV